MKTVALASGLMIVGLAVFLVISCLFRDAKRRAAWYRFGWLVSWIVISAFLLAWPAEDLEAMIAVWAVASFGFIPAACLIGFRRASAVEEPIQPLETTRGK